MNYMLIERIIWNIVWCLMIRPFPRQKACKWEIFLLRLFGAQVDYSCTIYSSAKIWLPRNLKMDQYATIADHVEILNSVLVYLKEHSRVSQYSYICPGSHDISELTLPGISEPIIIGEWAWVTSKCYIGMGVKIGRGSVISAGSVVFNNVPPYSVVMGNPAKIVGYRYTPKEVLQLEKNLFREEYRLSADVLERNYEKFYISRIGDIIKYIKI